MNQEISNGVRKGLLLVMGTAFISGFSIFINKFAVSVGTASAFTFLKNITVALLIISLLLAGKGWVEMKKLDYRKWLKLVLIGLIGGSVPFIMFFKGLALTTAAQGGLIQKTMFILVSIMAVLFLKEKISKRLVFCAFLIFASNMILLKSLNLSFGRGDLLVFGATLFWAVENIISKSALKELSGNLVAWGRMFFGSLFIFVYLIASGELATISSISFNQIGWILLTSVLLFGYVITWYSGLKKVPVSIAAVILLSGSVITTLLSAITAGKLGQIEIISSSVALLGIIILVKPFFSINEIKIYDKECQRS